LKFAKAQFWHSSAIPAFLAIFSNSGNCFQLPNYQITQLLNPKEPMETFLQDIRYGLRMLLKNPAFTTVAVITLALGIGANTAIFSLINALMLRMLPVKNPAELVVIGDPAGVHSRSSGTPQLRYFSYPLFRAFRDNTSAFSGMLVSGEVNRTRVSKGRVDISTSADAILVSGNYFSVFGVTPFMGRVLNPEDDDVKGKHPVAVVGYDFWKQKLGQDRNILGQTVSLNNYPFSIVGVAPPGFSGDTVGDNQDFWIPMMMQEQLMPGRQLLETLNVSWLHIIARLKPGVSVDQARANVNVVFKHFVNGPESAKLSADDKEELRKSSVDVVPGGKGFSDLRETFFAGLMLLMTIVALVLLIACVNVANLLLARASARQREIAVRLAVGAARMRLIRQLLTESLLLALGGGASGLLVAHWGTQAILRLAVSRSSADALDVHPNPIVLGFTAGVCVLAGLLFGLVPALKSLRVDVTPTLKDRSQQQSTEGMFRRLNWGKVLVALQVSLSLLVLFAAGLLVRTLSNLKTLDLGYDREHLLQIRTDPVAGGYKGQRVVDFANEITSRLAGVPGVRGVTMCKNGLFAGSDSADDVKFDGYTPLKGDDAQAHWDWAGPSYFSTLGVPLILGRDIGPQDTATSPRVAVINETMARFYFGTANPIGRRMRTDSEPIEIVGVARDARGMALRGPMERRFYQPFAQTSQNEMANVVFILRTAGDPSAAGESARKVLTNFNANVPIIWIRSVDTRINDALGTETMIARLSSFFGVLALLLACVGLYGVMSYTVSGRTKEIGLRMALGAQRPAVLGMVLREVMKIVLIGVAVGVPVALAATQLLRSMLFGLKATDPISLILVILLLGTVALLAGLIPARRATRVDPMVALRYE
jgi:predicted permease